MRIGLGSTPPESTALPLWEVETDATEVVPLRRLPFSPNLAKLQAK